MSLYLIIVIVFLLYFLFRIVVLNEKISSGKLGGVLFSILTITFWIFFLYISIFQYIVPFDFYSAFSKQKKEMIIRNDTYVESDLIFLSRSNENDPWDIEYPKGSNHFSPHFKIAPNEKSRVTIYSNAKNLAVMNFRGSYKIGSIKSFNTYNEHTFKFNVSGINQVKSVLISNEKIISDILLYLTSLLAVAVLFFNREKYGKVIAFTIMSVVILISVYQTFKLTQLLQEIN